MTTEHAALGATLGRWLQLRGQALPRGQIRTVLGKLAIPLPGPDADDWTEVVAEAAAELDPGARFVRLDSPDIAALPLLCRHDEHGWLVVQSRDAQGLWLAEDANGLRRSLPLDSQPCLHRIAIDENRDGPLTARQLIKDQFKVNRGVFVEAGLTSLLLTVVGLLVSFYSMQVYDRVIPSQGYQTLWVLSIGVVFSIVLEWFVKVARAHLIEPRLKEMDLNLSKAIFARMTAVRMDQRPPMVGTLASQLQGYEMIRGVLSASTLFLAFDLPMALVFVLVIALVGGPWMATVPLVLFPIATFAGLVQRQRMQRLVAASVDTGNRKTGLLVESIEGAETIKGLGAGWRFEGRWAGLVETNASQTLQIKHLTDATGYMAAAFQQIGYVLMVALGATLTIQGQITQGALIACSILSGRVMGPSAMIPGLIVQLAHAAAALKGLEHVFSLKRDNEGVERPIVPGVVRGELRFDAVEFGYPGRGAALSVKHLQIQPGERVALIGAIGAGKSTMLGLACGQFKPQKGTVFLDGMDIAQIHAGWVTANIAYMPQTSWLGSGTLRDNLLLGQPDLGDEAVIEACRKTGLWRLIGQNAKGLDMPISEGGRGLSGGQRQLVALTRHLVADKRIWLLDEPTSGMDEGMEQHCVAVLGEALRSVDGGRTLLLVTHRPALLALVERVVVIDAAGGVVLDGPRDQVLQQLSRARQATPAAGQPQPASVAATAAAAQPSHPASQSGPVPA
ncbi:ATP-binding cassette domain-containing protein [Leptothrix discophora]|uniref:ATP-binding cassette domain-containing protein n=1 Tax=Leptothrix discophora TaxID=89 RepID=A0ABT9G2P3_LEPDI|nr:ATP-binding cassette domain-containing protein [Leptothrix discophora]MDP4300759.1 ATP-binding cassette domain-containing protein [Leptothrix discophora]